MGNTFGPNGFSIGSRPPVSLSKSLTDFRRAPGWLLLPDLDDQRFDLNWQLVGLAVRPPGAIGEGFETAILIAADDLVPGLAGNTELASERCKDALRGVMLARRRARFWRAAAGQPGARGGEAERIYRGA